MAGLFGFMCFISLVLLIIGLIKPEAVIRWSENKGRKQVVLYFGIATVVFGIIATSFDTGSLSRLDDSKYPYHFINSQTEHNSTWVNTMDLYSCSEPLNLNQLKEFCKYKKDSYSRNGFYYMVVFDDEKNAVFPTTGFSGVFGGNGDVLKHIRVIYKFNKANDYSELEYYEKNGGESVPVVEKI